MAMSRRSSTSRHADDLEQTRIPLALGQLDLSDLVLVSVRGADEGKEAPRRFDVVVRGSW